MTAGYSAKRFPLTKSREYDEKSPIIIIVAIEFVQGFIEMTASTNILILALVFCSSQSADVKSRYYPRYHLAPPHGWMNDPNGFSFFRGEYHLFYQYNPESSQEPGIAHWGHAKSQDMVFWEHLPIAMYPNEWYDKTGVFSGSAIVENDTMYIYYTGNLNHPGETPDHEQHQALAVSTDGVNVTKYNENPVIVGADLQPNIRDPKVWKHGDTYYMVLGHSINETYGSVYLFTSEDRINWTQASILAESDGSLGYMFESPDFFELDGKFVLLFSPQGIKPQGDDYKNLYQTGYIIGDFDYETNQFTHQSEFKELDHGHDFYATQTIDDGGRRIMIAWMDMWEQNYPERNDGFTGLMTLPRVLTLTRDGHLLQQPIGEIKRATKNVLYSGFSSSFSPITLDDKAGEINILAPSNSVLEVFIESQSNSSNLVTISYDPHRHTVTLDRGGDDGVRRTTWKPRGFLLRWKIYVDASSIELFCGNGEVTFSSRFFPDSPVVVRAKSSRFSSLRVVSLARTVEVPSND